MRHERTQWNVGQGGFHTASLFNTTSNSQPIFQYIYDCGSISSRQPGDAIDEYVLSLGSAKRLDAIFLSRIDQDHVNGLPMLLRKTGVSAEYILLPLLSPAERSIAATRDSSGMTPFQADLAADPIAALREISDARIVEVKKDDAAIGSDVVDLELIAGDEFESPVYVVGRVGTPRSCDWAIP